ncbi:hypothetical protein [Mucilaginibacter terrae]|uniref:YbjN domain-containing protein n=1 Tax=Mucilaginibacter terrae TaxID=1955052 RepID=A0ABU3GUU5_9SPHI|nr:hypothetical protein [Mucilaginibacter terrae]MDT3403545.1 hypothetical protein [Mucilaginibacter terrae]
MWANHVIETLESSVVSVYKRINEAINSYEDIGYLKVLRNDGDGILDIKIGAEKFTIKSRIAANANRVFFNVYEYVFDTRFPNREREQLVDELFFYKENNGTVYFATNKNICFEINSKRNDLVISFLERFDNYTDSKNNRYNQLINS